MPSNRAEFTDRELVAILGDEALPAAAKSFRVRGVSSDTRQLSAGNLFVALRGERFDGHRFLRQAVDSGAAALLCERSAAIQAKDLPANFPLLLVNDSLKALGRLAAFHRRRFDIPLIAIAGSAGKTSTKDMTAAVLATRFRVCKTEGNLNNRIGTPLTLLGLSADDEAAVVEIGTNEPGEIAELAEICAPTHGLITNIAKEHLEKLIDLDGVEREETALFRYLLDKGGNIFVNLDDERLQPYAATSRSTSFGCSSAADLRGDIDLTEDARVLLRLHFLPGAPIIGMQSLGRVAGLNALAAAALGAHFGLGEDDIRKALGSYEATRQTAYARMRRDMIGDITVLNDCYNAQPSSMRAALQTLDALQAPGRKFALLGDMRELGGASHHEHRTLLETVGRLYPDVKLVLLGPEMQQALNASQEEQARTDEPYPQWMASGSEAAEFLASKLSTGDVLLVKGSRGMQLETIIEQLTDTLSPPSTH